MPRFTERWRVAAAILSAVVLAVAVGASTVGAKGSAKRTSGTIWIAATPRSSSGLLFVAGQIRDKVLGDDAVTFTIKPLVSPKGTVTAKAIKVTLWTPNGSLTGSGSAQITITNKPKTGDSTVSNGTVKLTKGTGGQAGHSFQAKFTGFGNISGALYTFKYKGTYK